MSGHHPAHVAPVGRAIGAAQVAAHARVFATEESSLRRPSLYSSAMRDYSFHSHVACVNVRREVGVTRPVLYKRHSLTGAV